MSATWYAYVGKACVDILSGSYFSTMGQADSSGKVWLYPEELLYLLERGSMECWWPEGAPMSLQGAYSACCQVSGDLERFQTYSYLKKLGYIVQRAPTYDADAFGCSTDVATNSEAVGSALSHMCGLSAFKSGLTYMHYVYKVMCLNPTNPTTLLWQGLFRSYSDVYSKLQIVKSKPLHAQTKTRIDRPPGSSAFRIVFHVWKPTTNWKKKTPGPPDMYIAVVSTREEGLPTLDTLESVFGCVPIDPGARNKKPIHRLKDGWRDVKLAVIDAGVISFFTVADVYFNQEQKL